MAELPSPLAPEINALIEQATVDFERYGAALFKAVWDLIQGGKLLPMTEETRVRLERLYRAHEAAVLMRFSGTALDLEGLKLAIKTGRIGPGYEGARGHNTLSLLYRAGRAHDVTGPPKVRGATTTVDALRKARETPISSREDATLNYIQQRGAVYMRRPVMAARTAVDRVLTEAEYSKVRGAVALGVDEGFSAKRLAQELRDATSGTVLLNDMRRVARTEAAFSAHAGALATLQEHAERAGEKDPQVYKIISPGACAQCRRIWGTFGSPVIYRLSEIVGRSNFGLPAKEWGPTIGPTHPNCFPAGHSVVTKRGYLPIEDVSVGDEVWTHKGRWRPVKSVFKSVHRGDLIIVAAGEHVLESTPEHPFLVEGRVWQEASALKLGDRLTESPDVPVSAKSYAQDAPSKRREVAGFSVVLEDLLGGGMPRSVDLYRHEEMGECQINGQRTQGHQWLGVKPRGDEEFLESGLKFTEILTTLTGFASHYEFASGDMATASRCISCGGSGLSLLWSQPPVRNDQLIMDGARGQSVALEPVSDHLASDTHSCGDFFDAIASKECVDDCDLVNGALVDWHKTSVMEHYRYAPVTSISRRTFNGQVYNLSVEDDESYICNGVVVHNCTCPPLMLYHPKWQGAIEQAAARVRALAGE